MSATSTGTSPAGYPFPTVTQGDTLTEVQFNGTPDGVVPDLASVEFECGEAGCPGTLLRLNTSNIGGITITDASTWSFEFEPIPTVDLPACTLVYTITLTDADSVILTAFKGTWLIQSK